MKKFVLQLRCLVGGLKFTEFLGGGKKHILFVCTEKLGNLGKFGLLIISKVKQGLKFDKNVVDSNSRAGLVKTNGGKNGFTLIELLIAITIFVSFLVVVSNSFISIVRAQKTANETRLIYSEMRNFVDFVNGELREGGIDYFCYNPPTSGLTGQTNSAFARCNDNSLLIGGGNNLRILSKDGLLSTIIKFDADVVYGGGKVQVQKFKRDNDSWVPEAGYADFQEYAFSNLKVDQLNFEITPKESPKLNSGKLNTQIQPQVFLTLQVSSKNPSVKFDLDFQTLMTARAIL